VIGISHCQRVQSASEERVDVRFVGLPEHLTKPGAQGFHELGEEPLSFDRFSFGRRCGSDEPYCGKKGTLLPRFLHIQRVCASRNMGKPVPSIPGRVAERVAREQPAEHREGGHQDEVDER